MNWRRLNFERPSPEYVLQQIRILGWVLEMARECLTLAPEDYLLAQNTSVHARPLRNRGSQKLGRCVGLAGLKTASKQCSECGAELYECHVETCAMCRAVFCPPCSSLHQEQHPKAASADHEQDRERKKRLAPIPASQPLTPRRTRLMREPLRD